MASHSVDQFAGFGIPDLQHAILAAGDEPAIRVDSYGPDPVRVLQGVEWYAGLQIPHLDRLVRTTANEEPPIRTDSHGQNPVRMPSKSAKQFAGLEVPQLNLLIRTAAGEKLAIRTDSNGKNPG